MSAKMHLASSLPAGTEFRPVPGFPSCLVGADGSVWRKRPKGWLKLSPTRGSKIPYLRVVLCDDGRRWPVNVHRLVLIAFVGPCPPGLACRHLDGNPANNALKNLCWDTYSENLRDRKRHGRSPGVGAKNSQARLTEDAVREIRRRRQAGEKLNDLAAAFHVDFRTISEVARWVRWPHVDRQEIRPPTPTQAAEPNEAPPCPGP
jgi:hypothetical protein